MIGRWLRFRIGCRKVKEVKRGGIKGIWKVIMIGSEVKVMRCGLENRV